jgi:hypothetical protein
MPSDEADRETMAACQRRTGQALEHPSDPRAEGQDIGSRRNTRQGKAEHESLFVQPVAPFHEFVVNHPRGRTTTAQREIGVAKERGGKLPETGAELVLRLRPKARPPSIFSSRLLRCLTLVEAHQRECALTRPACPRAQVRRAPAARLVQPVRWTD